MRKSVSLKKLYENGIKALKFGGNIVFHDEDYDLLLCEDTVVALCDGEELDFGEWCYDETDGKFIVGTAESGIKIYFSKEEYELAVTEKQSIELGKKYSFAGYKWTACELINGGKTVVLQSHGVTSGVWPGYKNFKFGGETDGFYTSNIDGVNISTYDDKMQALYDTIKEAEDISSSYGKGLYLISKEKVGYMKMDSPGSAFYWQALKTAAKYARSFGSSNYDAWLGTVYGSNDAWFVDSNGSVYHGSRQDIDFVIAPAFNLDLSKVEIRDNKIIMKDDKPQTFGIMLIEKLNVDGLTRAEVMEMYDQMNGDEAYPLEINGSESSAMGFITKDSAKILDYEYSEESGLGDFIKVILKGMGNESEDGTYEFRGIRIHLSR